MDQYHVASIQMTSTQNVSQNLSCAKKYITEAAQKGAKLVVLPEMFAFMGIEENERLRIGEEPGQGQIQDFLRKEATTNQVWIVGGTLPVRSEEENKIYAASFVYNDKGEQIARYNKIHLFDVQLSSAQEKYRESEVVKPGKDVVVIDTPFGKLGIAVCYDIRFPEFFRQMQEKGAEIIALPTAFTYTTGAAHWDILVRARAIENLCYIVASCQGGIHTSGRKTYGHSMIINPWGEIKATMQRGTGVVDGVINLDYLKEIRQEFPVLRHRRF